jgi:hypothetical protein
LSGWSTRFGRGCPATQLGIGSAAGDARQAVRRAGHRESSNRRASGHPYGSDARIFDPTAARQSSTGCGTDCAAEESHRTTLGRRSLSRNGGGLEWLRRGGFWWPTRRVIESGAERRGGAGPLSQNPPRSARRSESVEGAALRQQSARGLLKALVRESSHQLHRVPGSRSVERPSAFGLPGSLVSDGHPGRAG